MSANHLPENWRERLPSVMLYYALHIRDLGTPNAAGWAQAVCPFHSDSNNSLSVNLAGSRGHWRCSGPCGGGDLLGFHMRLRGLDFKAAVRDLVGLRQAA